MSHARIHFSNYHLLWYIFLIAAAIGKPGFRGIFTFLVSFLNVKVEPLFKMICVKRW